VFKIIIFSLVNAKQYSVLVLLVLLNIKEKFNGRDRCFFSNPSDRITILALDSNRYRGDLDVLSSHPDVRILFMNQSPPGWLIKPFYNGTDISRYINAKKDSRDAFDHKRAYKFMHAFLNIFYKYVSIDCVVTVNYRYLEDYNWAKASDRLGVPFIMLYRECLLKSDRTYDAAVYRAKTQFGKFHGSHIIVHNDRCKQVFIDSKYISKDKISVVGALRMDKYLRTIKAGPNRIKNKRKRFVLFYFPYTQSLFGKHGGQDFDQSFKYKYAFSIWPERKNYFREVHSAIAELAVENPDIDFVIKPKSIMMKGESWEYYEQVLNEISFDINKVDNYSIEPDIDVHGLILDSDVFCALQSSTAIEAAISGKPVILPIFENYRSTENYQDFAWKNYLDIFDVANNAQHFKDLIIKLINCPTVSSHILNKRKKVFKFFFNDLDGISRNGYIDVIKNVIKVSHNHKHGRVE